MWNLEVVSVNSPDAKEAKANPLGQNAFILNLGEHWFTVRKIGGVFWNLNSLNKGPEEIGDFYLSLLFDTLQNEGYAIFVIYGELPDFRNMSGDGFATSGGGRVVTCFPKAKGGGGRAVDTSGDALQSAINASLQQEDDDDGDMAAAIAASLASVNSSPPAPAAADDSDDRAFALSRALSAPEPDAGSADAYVLQVRLRADGSTLKRAWHGDAPLSAVYDFVYGSAAAAKKDGMLRDAGDRKEYPCSQQSVKQVFGATKRVALIFE